ncbi:unnamed protein product [Ceratitis capitata]|uniref:(Mediterranean fruit fly) hypothetical protein n=1 Tax=Ceratitis capitata TaxID=7213 RepID=A0A811U824_CERCA|nr:unnamed protein product [Ceratitis capitata]
MVMLQSPAKTADALPANTVGGQLSPNSNPDSPKSNTSPEVACSNVGGAVTPTSTTPSASLTPKIPKFIISQQTLTVAAGATANNNSTNTTAGKSTNNTAGDSLRYSLERLKQMTEINVVNRLSPTATSSSTPEPMDGEKCNNNNNINNNNNCNVSNNNMNINGNITPNNNNNCNTRRSLSPPPVATYQSPPQRKLLELNDSPCQLPRPEPLPHPHAALLQQHPHLLQNPQFLAAAAAQHHHQQHQHQLQHQHQQHHHHLHQQTAHHALADFHSLRPPLTNMIGLPPPPPLPSLHQRLPSPASSPLSPPTSPLQPHSEQPQMLSPVQPQHHQQHQQQHAAQQTPTSTCPSASTLSPQHQHHLLSTPPSSMLLNGTHSLSSHAAQQLTNCSPSSTLTTAHDMDLERIKLVAAQAVAARSTVTLNSAANASGGSSTSSSSAAAVTAASMAAAASGLCLPSSNARPDLSDYGFRIQLGGLAAAAAAAAATSRQIAAANYARSDTSEELNVDGNDEDSNDGSHGTPTACPVDLTRSVPTNASTTSSATNASLEKEATKRLAFSVENILDPNKFTGRNGPTGHYGGGRGWGSSSSNADRDDEMHDDEHSEDMSGE